MNPPRVGEILSGAFGAVLAVSLFLPWYREQSQTGDSSNLTAWEAFAALDVLLVVVALGGLGLLFAEITQRTHAVATAWASILTPIAVVAAALVLWRTLSPGESREALFALLGLVAATGLAAGSLLSMRNEGLDRARGRSSSEPELLAAPPVAGEER